MSGKIIIITGYLAAGKSTFARRLSETVSVPCIIKDTFKIALCESVSTVSREETSRFSAVTFDGIIYVTERLLETGQSIIIEGNFVPAGIKNKDEAGTIKALIDKYNCQSLTYKFVGDTRILHERFVEREKLPERGQVNKFHDDVLYDVFDKWCSNLDAFNVGGKTIQIDTTNFEKVDFNSYIKTACDFFGGYENDNIQKS